LKSRRDGTKIIHEILMATRSGVSKTQIVYKTNLNFQLAGKYITFLLSKGLLQTNAGPDGPTQYELTNSGESLLVFLTEVDKALDRTVWDQSKGPRLSLTEVDPFGSSLETSRKHNSIALEPS